jgi:uncharacterized protein with HEPN domain
MIHSYASAICWTTRAKPSKWPEKKTSAELEKNRQLGLALIHLVELIGEAASQVPRDIQTQYPQIPWPEIISTRNRLIHGYDYVDYDILFCPR